MRDPPALGMRSADAAPATVSITRSAAFGPGTIGSMAPRSRSRSVRSMSLLLMSGLLQFEGAAQALDAATDARFGRPDRAPADGRDLLERKVEVVTGDDREPDPRRHPAQGVHEINGGSGVDARDRDLRWVGKAKHRRPARSAGLAALVRHDCQEPRPELGSGPAVSPFAPSTERRTLHCVLGILRIEPHARSEAQRGRKQRPQLRVEVVGKGALTGAVDPGRRARALFCRHARHVLNTGRRGNRVLLPHAEQPEGPLPGATRRSAPRLARLRVEAEPCDVEGPQPQVAPSAVAIGAVQRPSSQLDDAVAKRLGRKGQGPGPDHAQRGSLRPPSFEEVEHDLGAEARRTDSQARVAERVRGATTEARAPERAAPAAGVDRAAPSMSETNPGELREGRKEVAGELVERCCALLEVRRDAVAKVIHGVVTAPEDARVCGEAVVVKLVAAIGDALTMLPTDGVELR